MIEETRMPQLWRNYFVIVAAACVWTTRSAFGVSSNHGWLTINAIVLGFFLGCAFCLWGDK